MSLASLVNAAVAFVLSRSVIVLAAIADAEMAAGKPA